MLIDKNQIIQSDCLEVLRGMKDEVIDLTVTSPPYDNLRNYNGYSFDFEGIAKELYRVTKQGGIVVWVVGDATVKGSETGTSFKQALYFKEIGFNLHDTMIFEKDVLSFPETNRYYQHFEYMFILSKGKPKTTNLIDDRKNLWGGVNIKGGYRDTDGQIKQKSGNKKGKTVKEFGIRFNIWKYNVGWNKSYKEEYLKGHPAIFPEKLAEDHILSWSNEGDIILDPFAGSGTTLKMAKKNNRDYVGIEVNKEYIDLINKRLCLNIE